MPFPTGVTLDIDATAGITTSGANVTAIAEQSGHGNNPGIVGTPTLVTVNGVKWLRFDGTSYLTLPAGFSTNRQGCTALIGYRIIGSLNAGMMTFSPGAGFDADLYIDANSFVADGSNSAINDSAIKVADGPQLLGMKCDAGAVTLYLDGESGDVVANLAGSVTGGDLFAWANGNGHRLIGDCNRLVVFDHALSASELTDARADFLSRLKVGAATNDYFFVFDGDSITFGLGLPAPITDNYWPIQLARLFNHHPKFYNAAVSGQTLATCVTNYSTNVGPRYAQNSAFGAGRWVCIFAGTNDIFTGSTDAAVKASMTSYVSNAHTTGFKVLAPTILPRSIFSGTQETYRQSFNAWLVAGSSGADIIVNLDADARLANPADTSVYQDGTHPTLVGAGYIAQDVFAPFAPASSSGGRIGRWNDIFAAGMIGAGGVRF